MKITVEQLRTMVNSAINEAKKKRKKDLGEAEARPDGYMSDKNMDFSKPLGALNYYRMQGSANFGPYTGDPDSMIGSASGVDMDIPRYGTKMEAALRAVVGQMISEELRPDPVSAWARLMPAPPPPAPTNIWEAAMHYYDFQRRGLGQMKEEAKPSKSDERKADAKDKKVAKGKAKKAGRK
jgi:hypothetical protein